MTYPRGVWYDLAEGVIMNKNPSHIKNIVSLKRVEGQIRGIQKMIEDKKYCIDVVTQLHAAVNGLYRVSEKILESHIEHCVVDAIRGKSEKEKSQKINEMMQVIKRLRKL